MTEFHADQLRDDAGRLEAQIEALSKVRETWAEVRTKPDCPPSLAEFAIEQIDKLDDQIGALQRQVEDLDDDIHFAHPECP